MTRILVMTFLLAGCAGVSTRSEDGGTTPAPGEASFSMCVGFCVNRVGPPVVITPPPPAPVTAAPAKR